MNNFLKELSVIINDIPIEIPFIKKTIENNVERLVFLLCGKNSDYEGPLYDKYEDNEWLTISLLISNWLLESYNEIKKNKKIAEYNIKVFFQKENITKLSLYIIKKIIEHALIPNIDSKLVLGHINAYENTEMIRIVIENEVERLIEAMYDLILNNCMCCNKNKGKKILEQRSYEHGKVSKIVNRQIKLNRIIHCVEEGKKEE